MKARQSTFKTPMLSQNRTMALLYSRIQQQNLILERIRTALPAALLEHAKHCVVKDDKLLLYTDAAVWATQLRFCADSILAAVGTLPDGGRVAKLQIKIITLQTGLGLQPRRKAVLPSREKIAMLEQDSRAIEDEGLKSAMLSLSATLARLSNRG